MLLSICTDRCSPRVQKLLLLLLASLVCSTLPAQIFVANNNGTVAAYTTAGTLQNPAFISGLYAPSALAYDSGYLYTASIVGFGDTRAVINKYNLAGTQIGASILSGPQQYFPSAMAEDGHGHLYVGFGDGSVWAYSTSGTPLYASPLFMLSGRPGGFAFGPNGDLYATSGYGDITEFTTAGQLVNNWNYPSLGYSGGLAVSGNFLYAEGQNGQVSAFTTAGAAVNLNLISGFVDARSLAADNLGHLFVADGYLNRIGAYSISGATINESFITAGLAYPTAIVLVPEPGFASLLLLGTVALLCARRRKGEVNCSPRNFR
jgi:hypothetical protein